MNPDDRPAGAKRCPDFAKILKASPPDVRLTEQLVACFTKEIGRLARQRCRDLALADDARQDAMITLIQSLDAYRGEAPLRHWLQRLVLTACNRLRRGQRNDPALNLPLDDVPPDADPLVVLGSQELRLLLNERFELLQGVLSEVPEPNRSLLLLHEGQDVPLEQLALRFGLTLDGVKSRLKRLRTQLLLFLLGKTR